MSNSTLPACIEIISDNVLRRRASKARKAIAELLDCTDFFDTWVELFDAERERPAPNQICEEARNWLDKAQGAARKLHDTGVFPEGVPYDEILRWFPPRPKERNVFVTEEYHIPDEVPLLLIQLQTRLKRLGDEVKESPRTLFAPTATIGQTDETANAKTEQGEGNGGKGIASQPILWDRLKKWALNKWVVVFFIVIGMVVAYSAALVLNLKTLINWK